VKGGENRRPQYYPKVLSPVCGSLGSPVVWWMRWNTWITGSMTKFPLCEKRCSKTSSVSEKSPTENEGFKKGMITQHQTFLTGSSPPKTHLQNSNHSFDLNTKKKNSPL